MADDKMVRSVRHTGLVVADLERSLTFYRDMLGLSIYQRMTESGPFIERIVGLPGVVLEWVKLLAPDGSLVELLKYQNQAARLVGEGYSKSDTLGFSHIAFTVAEIETLYKRLCKKGFHCNCAPQVSPDGLVKVVYCHDPDGIVVELVEELPRQMATE